MSTPYQLNLYIPRVASTHTEETVRFNIEERRIGKVEYVDFVKCPPDKNLKHNTPHQPTYFQVFVKLEFWDNRHTAPRNEFHEYGQYKIFIDNSNYYWLVLPNTNPIARSRVNTHQLVEYTEQLFVKTANLETDFEKLSVKHCMRIFETDQLMDRTEKIENQLKHIDGFQIEKNTEMNSLISIQGIEIKQLKQQIKEQSEAITLLQNMMISTLLSKSDFLQDIGRKNISTIKKVELVSNMIPLPYEEALRYQAAATTEEERKKREMEYAMRWNDDEEESTYAEDWSNEQSRRSRMGVKRDAAEK